MKKHERQQMDALDALFGILNEIVSDTERDDEPSKKSANRSDEPEMTYEDYLRAKSGEQQNPEDCHDAYESGYQSGFSDGVDSVADDMIPGLTIPTLREKILHEMYTEVGQIHPSEIKLLAESLLILAQSDAINYSMRESLSGSDGDSTEEHA